MGNKGTGAAAETAQPTAGTGMTVLDAHGADDNIRAFFAAPETPTEAAADAAEPTEAIVPSNTNQDRSQSLEEGDGQESRVEGQKAEAEAEDEGANKEAASADDAEAEVEGQESRVEAKESQEPEWFQKRIGKEVKKRKELEEQLAELRAKLEAGVEGRESRGESQKAEAKAEPNDDPVLSFPEVQQAAQEVAKHEENKARAKELLKQLRHDPDAVAQTLKQAGWKLPSWDEDTLRDTLENVREETVKAVAEASAKRVLAEERAKAAVENNRRQLEEMAKAEFPFLNDPDSEEFGMVQAALKQRPWLRKDPAGLFSAAATIAAMRAVQARQSRGSKVEGRETKTKATATPPKLPGATGQAPPAKTTTAPTPPNWQAIATDPEALTEHQRNFFAGL